MSLATIHHPAIDVAPKPRRAKSSRATSRPDAERARKVSFYLSAEAIRRLGIAATMEETDKSRLLERVIQSSPVVKQWVVSNRAKSEDCGTPEGSADHAA